MDVVRRRGSHWTRHAAIAVLVLCLAPMTLVVTGCCTLASLIIVGATRPRPHVIPAGEAMRLTPGRDVALHLRDGSTVSGPFRGRTLLESDTYARRFAERERSGAWTPFTLGESIQVELVDGRTLAAPFAGYAMRALLLRPDANQEPVRVPFDSTRSVRGPGGAAISPDSLLAADVRGELPSAEALAVDEGLFRGSITQRQPHDVPFEDIVTATVRERRKHATGIIALGVGLDLVLIAAAAAVAGSTWGSYGSGCSSGMTLADRSDPAIPWTDRPFDRIHARFFDEPIATFESTAVPPAGPGPLPAPSPMRTPATERSAGAP